MDVRQVEYVLAVVDRGSFTKAADSLGVSQPSLSDGIRRLETELDVRLFDRVGRSVALTDAGQAF
ncbi:MAG TPA: LysR family transcriptional regulator, partial [Acidimicrobiia bacterium]|nr:LysR family transcriptional regulator [Acidimicrobiia bacterium]